MKANIIDKQFNNIALPPIQDLRKHEELLQKKHNPTKNNVMKVKTLKTLTHWVEILVSKNSNKQ